MTFLLEKFVGVTGRRGMLDGKNTLLCVFSFNMGRTLDNCLRSIDRHCANFPVAVADDASEDPETLRVLRERRATLRELFVNMTPKEGRRLGNLYSNIQRMCDFANAEGFRYLFMIQDDMQFVRPLDERVRREYRTLLDIGDVLQVDTRFLRETVKAKVLPDIRAYGFQEDDVRGSYADVGLLDLEKLGGWSFLPSERENKRGLTALGYRRLFPFTPTMMHVPYPLLYRHGEPQGLKAFPLCRGNYSYHDMTADEIAAMDKRDIFKLPLFRNHLRPKNMWLSYFQYKFGREKRLFG